ncbi:MAG: hypothetical protein ACYDEY_13465 [Acidimicrobiales bacterium]
MTTYSGTDFVLVYAVKNTKQRRTGRSDRGAPDRVPGVWVRDVPPCKTSLPVLHGRPGAGVRVQGGLARTQPSGLSAGERARSLAIAIAMARWCVSGAWARECSICRNRSGR